MKKASLFVLIIGLFFAFACEKAEDNYAFYRATDSTNFKTNLGGELYLFGFQDSAFEIADYYLGVKSSLTSYGEDVIATGYVWSPSNSDPRLGAANTLDTTYNSGNLDIRHRIRNLTDDTEYYVRSFVVTEKDTGYNQHVTKLKTHPALDEWREMTGETNKPSGRRYDAFAFNMGDTVILGTGNQGVNAPLSDIQIFIPNQGWSELAAMPIHPLLNKRNVTGAIGFGLRFKKNMDGPPRYTTRFYVGLGDYEGDNSVANKSNYLFEYNLDQSEEGANWTGNKFAYPVKATHAVSFVIDDMVYIGTGMSSYLAVSDWYVFFPAYAIDNAPETLAFRPMGNNKPNDGYAPDYGRYGAVATSVNGNGYFGLGLVGGLNVFLKDWYKYSPKEDPTGGTWVEMAEFPGEARAHAAIFVIGDQIYVGGGDQVALGYNVPDIVDESIVGSQPIFNDFYRYDPFNDSWKPIRHYTQDKGERADAIRKITRPIAYSNQELGVGFVGSGITFDPNDNLLKAQSDFWKYLPYETDVK